MSDIEVKAATGSSERGSEANEFQSKTSMEGIKDKVIVITGASSGIGEATAIMLAKRGAKVVLGARGLDRLKSLARRIEGAGCEIAYARTDVRRKC